jgi:hypothetical protein
VTLAVADLAQQQNIFTGDKGRIRDLGQGLHGAHAIHLPDHRKDVQGLNREVQC